jgi:hypothetical protein
MRAYQVQSACGYYIGSRFFRQQIAGALILPFIRHFQENNTENAKNHLHGGNRIPDPVKP